MLPEKGKICFLIRLSLFMLFGAPLSAFAQGAKDEPAVQIDMSVLDTPENRSRRFFDSSESVTRTINRPSLTAPALPPPPSTEKTPPPVKTQPVVTPATKTMAPLVSSPPIVAPVLMPEPPAPLPVPATQKPQREIKTFPVQVKGRTEQYDPSIGESAAYSDAIVTKKEKPSVNIPFPPLKPVKSAKQAKIIGSAPAIKTVKVPIPPRRPSIQQASKKFVENARAQIKTDSGTKTEGNIIKKTTAEKFDFNRMDLSKGGMQMPAVPAQTVQTETLFTPPPHKKSHSHDPLGKQLVTPDKATMLKSIESVSATNAIPKKNPVPEKSAIIDITEMPESLPTPRPPPKSEEETKGLEYISLPFAAEQTELNKDAMQTLDQKVIPILQDNRKWRLQIRAFAHSTDEESQNARRISLSRALFVRSYLLEKGIEARRLDIRALGMDGNHDSADRVDFIFFDTDAAE